MQAALGGIAANLATAGVAVFDINTLSAMREAFSSDSVAEDERHLVVWRGQGSANLAPGQQTSAQVDVLSRDGHLYSRATTTLLERHHPIREVTALLDACGLEIAQRLGQSPGVRIEREADELRPGKTLFVVRRLA